MAAQYKITDLTELVTLSDDDLFEVVDFANNTSKKIAWGTFGINAATWDATTATVSAGAAGWDSTKTTVDNNRETWDKATILVDDGSDSEFLAADGNYYSVSFSPSGADTQVQFNNAGSFGASAGFTYSNGAVLTAQDAAHKPLIINLADSHSVNAMEINSFGGSNGNLWRWLNTGVLRAGTNGDFSQPVLQFGNSNSGFYLDANRIFTKAGGAFSGGFSSVGFTGNSALMDTIVSLDDITLPRFIAYKQTLAGLKAGLGGNSDGDVALVTNNIARIKAYVGGGVNIPNLPTSATGLATGDLWNDSGTLKIA